MEAVPSISDPRPAPLPQQATGPAVGGVGGVGAAAAAGAAGTAAPTRQRTELIDNQPIDNQPIDNSRSTAPGTLLPVDSVSAPAGAPSAPVQPPIQAPTQPTVASPAPPGTPPGTQMPAPPAARSAPADHRTPPPAAAPPTSGPSPAGPPPWAGARDPDADQAWWTRATPDRDGPDTGSFPLLDTPAQRPPRDQTRLVIIGVAILVAVVLLFAVWSLRDFGEAGSGLLQDDPNFSSPPPRRSRPIPPRPR